MGLSKLLTLLLEKRRPDEGLDVSEILRLCPCLELGVARGAGVGVLDRLVS